MKSGPVDVVARLSEREALHRLLDRVTAGTGAALVLEGEAGIGKTALLDELAASAEGRGLRVLRGASTELDSDRAFGAIREAFGVRSSCSSDLAQLSSLLRMTDEPERDLRFRIVDELADLLELWCSVAPTLLIVEDLHWADPSTTLALPRLTRLTASLPLSLAVSLRPVPRPPHVRLAVDSLHAMGAASVVLDALADTEVVELAVAVLGRPPSTTETRRLRAAGGNPLFVVELLRAGCDGDVEHDQEAGLPPSLRLTLLSRVAALPEPTVEALRIASLLGTTFAAHHLALLLDCPTLEAVRALGPAYAAGLVRDAAEGAVAFRHDLVRDAVYDEMPLALRTSLHAQAGRVLAAAGATALEVARHVSLGAVAGDPAAVEVLVHAARQVRSTAPAVAVRLLERALELADPLSTREATVQAELAVALRTLGRGSAARAHAQAALASGALPTTLRFVLAHVVCETLNAAGQIRELSAIATAALRDPTLTPQERSLYAIYDWVVRVALVGEDPCRQGTTEDEILERLPVEDDVLVCYRTYGHGTMLFARGALPRSLSLLALALSLADRARLWREAADMRVLRAVMFAFLDQIVAAGREVREASRIADELGGPSTTAGGTSLVLFVAGRWDDLAVELDVRRQMALDEGDEPTFAELAWRAFLAVRAGSPAAAEQVAVAEDALQRQGPTMAVHLLIWARALLTERTRGASQAARRLLEDMQARPTDRYLVRLVAPDAVRLCLAAADQRGAQDMLTLLERVAEKWDAPSARAAVTRCRALRDGDAPGLLDAVAQYRETPARPDELAATLRDAAQALSSSDRAQSSRLAGEAADIFRRLGADHDADRCGALRAPQAAKPRATTGWDSLTPTEQRVVELVARGLRNKQIAAELYVSPRTVETHVSHAMQRLQVTSRVELAARSLTSLREARTP